MEMGGKTKSNRLKINIDIEGFKLEVESDQPNKTLAELNKLINSKKELFDAMDAEDPMEFFESLDEDDLSFDFKIRRFSKELRQNSENVEKIRNLMLKHKNFLYRKESLDIKQEIDLNNKKFRMVIEKKDINNLIQKLLFNISPSSLKHTVIHVIGDYFSKDHQSMLLDELKKKTGFSDSTFLFTPKNMDGGIVAETMFFGDFPQNQEEE